MTPLATLLVTVKTPDVLYGTYKKLLLLQFEVGLEVGSHFYGSLQNKKRVYQGYSNYSPESNFAWPARFSEKAEKLGSEHLRAQTKKSLSEKDRKRQI